MVISCSFGFQRRKLFSQLRCPTIFRTFVDPDEVFSKYKKAAFGSIMAYTEASKAAFAAASAAAAAATGMDLSSASAAAATPKARAASSIVPAAPALAHTTTPGGRSVSTMGLTSPTGAAHRKGSMLTAAAGDASASASASAPAPVVGFSNISVGAVGQPPPFVVDCEWYAAAYAASRTIDLRHLVYQFENFYALHHHGFAQARHMAMRNVLGVAYSEEMSALDALLLPKTPQELAAQRQQQRTPASENFDDLSLRKKLRTDAKIRYRLESQRCKMRDCNRSLHTYHDLFAQRMPGSDVDSLREVVFSKEENNPKTGPNMVDYTKKASKSQSQSQAQTEDRNHGGGGGSASGGPRKKTVVDLPGKPMHTDEFLEGVFQFDDEYAHLNGPGIELMKHWDAKDRDRTGRARANTGGILGSLSSSIDQHHQHQHQLRGITIGSPPPAAGHKGPISSMASVSEDSGQVGALRDMFSRDKALLIDKGPDAAKSDRNYMQQYVQHANRLSSSAL
jgi:hypothetical protein